MKKILVIFSFWFSLWIQHFAFSQELLTFDEAFNEILRRHTKTSIQETKIKESEAKLLPFRLNFVPTLSLNAKQVQGAPSSGSAQQLEANSQLNLFRWGADWASLKAAQADCDAEKETLLTTVLEAEREATQALINTIRNYKKTEIHKEIVQTHTHLLQIATQRYGQGRLPLQEVKKLEIDLENAKSNFASVVIDQKNSEAVLEKLLGPAVIQEEWPWQTKLLSFPYKNLKFELETHPFWKSTRYKIQAEESRTQRANRLMFPSLDGNLSYGYYSNLGIKGPAWSVGVTLTLPFFDQLNQYSNYKLQSYFQMEKETLYERTPKELQIEFENAQKNFEILNTTTFSRTKILETARELYRDNLRRFQLGRASANDLVIDERRVFDSELFFIQGVAELHLAFVRLCHAMGKRVRACF